MTLATRRAHLRKQNPTAAVAPPPREYARLAGKSDAIIKEKTGCTWERWVKALDRAKADTWAPPGDREACNGEVPDPRLVGPDGDRGLRADQGTARHRSVRTATPGKSMRITWPAETSVEVGFASKGPAKSLVAVQHVKLPDKAAATRVKEYWGRTARCVGGGVRVRRRAVWTAVCHPERSEGSLNR